MLILVDHDARFVPSLFLVLVLMPHCFAHRPEQFLFSDSFASFISVDIDPLLSDPWSNSYRCSLSLTCGADSESVDHDGGHEAIRYDFSQPAFLFPFHSFCLFLECFSFS